MMITAIEQAILLAETRDTEHLARGVQQLEGEIAAILSIVDIALDELAETDPIRADLEEIRAAARLAVAKAETLAARTKPRPLLRAV
ncbi:MAG TPA: hypothetical protein VIV11_40005 [Kofleriaceae bacterium]